MEQKYFFSAFRVFISGLYFLLEFGITEKT